MEAGANNEAGPELVRRLPAHRSRREPGFRSARTRRFLWSSEGGGGERWDTSQLLKEAPWSLEAKLRLASSLYGSVDRVQGQRPRTAG